MLTTDYQQTYSLKGFVIRGFQILNIVEILEELQRR